MPSRLNILTLRIYNTTTTQEEMAKLLLPNKRVSGNRNDNRKNYPSGKFNG